MSKPRTPGDAAPKKTATDAVGVGSTDDTEAVAGGGEATLLVSEFPPPPPYFRRHAALFPPPIPQDRIAAGTARAAALATQARAEAERLRHQADAAPGLNKAGAGADQTDAILGGAAAATKKDDNADAVAVFGEIVEDPVLVEPLDWCEHPHDVRGKVKTLNKQVLAGFVHLVEDLLHRPHENKMTRDELSHNIFLMLQEVNKFREHQAVVVLVELLESQLQSRQELIAELESDIAAADAILDPDNPVAQREDFP